jgi:hypothetical protein
VSEAPGDLPATTDHTVLFKELTDATVMTLQCENVTVTVTYPVESEWLAQGVIDQLPEILAAAIEKARENLGNQIVGEPTDG